MVTYIFFAIGLLFLVKGADFLIEGAVSVGKKYNLSNLIIGLTIISFGTSTPELVVNLIASLNGNHGIAIGNIFGSNIANILLILGVSSIILPLPISKRTYLSEIPFSLMAILLVGFLANASLFSDVSKLSLSTFDGMILLFFFLLYMGYIYIISKEENLDNLTEESQPISIFKSSLLIGAGILGLFLGGKWVVDGGIVIAKSFGFSEAFIGLTLIAVGTSLPELVTCVVATLKRKTDIAVGNVVGSNIFNLLWILGISATIKELPFEVVSNDDIIMIIFSSSILLFAIIIGKKSEQPNINRLEGVIFLMVYFGYIVFLLTRG